MSLYDFFFPDEAQASHLRRLANTAEMAHTQARIARSRGDQTRLSKDRRIEELEGEIGQLTIVIEALLENLSDRNILSREDIARKVGEIDLRDGVIDGRITRVDKPSNGCNLKPKLKFPDRLGS